jgi:ATP-dependent DNA ligase
VLSFIEPMTPTLVREPPRGCEWLHEIKYDGYRTQLIMDDAGVRAFTRRGFDVPRHARCGRDLRCSSMILDGKAIVQDEQGWSDFNSFAGAMVG